MDTLVIKTHNFEDAKLAIKKFSEQNTSKLNLKTVNGKKGVGEWLGDALLGGGIGINHKVTGKEFNELTVQIQSHLISINNTQIKLIQQFGEVYKALESLDKEYIQGILISINATQETSKGIAAAQEKITQIIEDQKKTLEILKKFKQKLDGYAHLGDIDKIWSDCQAWHEESSTLFSCMDAVTKLSEENNVAIKELTINQTATTNKLGNISNNLDEQISRIETIISFMDKLNIIVHLSDVDEMWNSLINAQVDLQKLCAEIVEAQITISKNAEDILKIQKFIDCISSQVHLNDIDEMWDKSDIHTSQITALQEQDKTIKDIINNNKEASVKAVFELQKCDEQLNQLIQSNKELAEQTIDALRKKIATQDEWIQINKEASDLSLSKLNDKTTTLHNLIQCNKDATDREFSCLREHDNAAIKLIEENKLLTEQAIEEANEQTSTMMQRLNNKLTYAYLIAGGSLTLAVAELVVLLLR